VPKPGTYFFKLKRLIEHLRPTFSACAASRFALIVSIAVKVDERTQREADPAAPCNAAYQV
jgi:hypothetical protein